MTVTEIINTMDTVRKKKKITMQVLDEMAERPKNSYCQMVLRAMNSGTGTLWMKNLMKYLDVLGLELRLHWKKETKEGD